MAKNAEVGDAGAEIDAALPISDNEMMQPAKLANALRSELASAALDGWFATHIHNSAISRDTRLVNEVSQLKENLKAHLGRLDE
jgi:hypothetical protein